MAPEHELRALIDGSRDAVRRVIADLREKAESAEQIRTAEHRAFMAEQREALAIMKRAIEDRLAAVRNGVDGKDGAPGRDGVDGHDGVAGQNGDDGLPGRDGQDGAPGRDGVDGKDGETGPQGEPGRDGTDGQDGASGRDGIDGQDGASGRDGIDGKDGAAGRDGIDGKDGAPGDQGLQGQAGAPGRDGSDGIDGKDAYVGQACGLFDPDAEYRAMDVVSFNGSEWRAKVDAPGALPGDGWMLSASRGKRGDRGERGEAGRTGERGANGSEIIAGYADDKDLTIVLTKDDGTEIKVDLYDLATKIRSA